MSGFSQYNDLGALGKSPRTSPYAFVTDYDTESSELDVDFWVEDPRPELIPAVHPNDLRELDSTFEASEIEISAANGSS